MIYKISVVALFLISTSHAFVSGPSAVNPNESYLQLTTQFERGKVEPSENKSSYQDAQIDIYKLKYARGFANLMGLPRSTVFTELGTFASAKEQVGQNIFYDKDQGSFWSLGIAPEFIHELDRLVGSYLQITPIRSYNEKKFSNPRLDFIALGIFTAFNITENYFQKNLIHFGSGDGSDQNSYLAIDIGFGRRLNQIIGHPMTITASLFLEADLSERYDTQYDAVFSPAGSRDRIKASKYGTLISSDVAITDQFSFQFNYLQKLGGYDARATQVYTANLGYKF